MKYTCEKCGRTMEETNFYTYRDGKKMEMCKKCLTMHIDNYDPETYLWILEKMNLPYVEQKWVEIRNKEYEKNPFAMNGMSVFGKYLSIMRLSQWKDFSWEDNEKIKEKMAQEQQVKSEEERLAQEAFEKEMKQRLDAGEISEAEYRTMVRTDTQRKDHPPTIPPELLDGVGKDNSFNEANFISEDELVDPSVEIDKEDLIRLAMKWGRLYKMNELLDLEKKYTDMQNSFDIQDSDTEGTLILICKTYLKMNQALDCGDFEGYQKLSRVSDSLRKSAKFTAAQNKEEKGDFVDSVGELVSICEKEGGFIPRLSLEIPQDKVDFTLRDLERYDYKLVTKDLGFGDQIENALKKIQIQKEMEKDEAEGTEELEDSDYEEFYKDKNNQLDKDYEQTQEKGDS